MPGDRLAATRGDRPSLSVFLPMYNEASYVEPMVAKVRSVLQRLTDDYEVLIVDDGSTDGCERIADALAAADPHVRVVHHPRNLGYGAALRTGFFSASKDLVFYTDCDEPVDLNDLEGALALMAPGVDLVVGYRTDRHDTPRRWMYSRAYNLLMRWMFGVRVRDVNFSFKLVRRAALQCLSLRAGSTFIDGELLAEAARCGYRVVEMPVEYHPRQMGRSSFDGLAAAAYTLQEMLSYLVRTGQARWLILWIALLVAFYVALRLVPLDRPLLFHDWHGFFENRASLTYYPPWTWWVADALDLPGLLAITLASYAVAVLKRARSVASAVCAFLCLPLWWTIFLGQFDGLSLLGVLGLPWLVPLVLMKPLVAGFAILARWRWAAVTLAFVVASVLLLGPWPIDMLAYHLNNPPEVWPQNIGLGWVGIPVFALLVWKMPRDDPDWWMLAGSALSPYLIAYHWLPLMPAAAKLPWYWALAVALASWLTFASNWLGGWAWYLGWTSVVLLGVGLWLHGGETAGQGHVDRTSKDDLVGWARQACLWVWRKIKVDDRQS